MQPRTTQPTKFINVFSDNGRFWTGAELQTSRKDAVEHAEGWADQYEYTLTDVGQLDLSAEFSEGWHEKRDFDAAVDRHIDELKEKRFARREA